MPGRERGHPCGPRTAWQRAAEVEPPPQGLERRGQQAFLLLGRVWGPAHSSWPSPLLRVGPGRLDSPRLPFQVRLREAPEPLGASRCSDIKVLRPNLIPWRKGQASRGGKQLSAIRSPLRPSARRSPDLQEAPRVSVGPSCPERQGLGGHEAAPPLGCVTSGRSLPFTVPWLPFSLPGSAGSRASLGKGLLGKRGFLGGAFWKIPWHLDPRSKQGARAHLG